MSHSSSSSSLSPSLLRDLMGNTPTRLSSLVCLEVIRAIQNAANGHRGAMLSGLTAAFVLVSERTGISVPDMMIYARNAMTDGERRYPEYKACADFLENEVL